MSAQTYLIDTNVIIGLEDNRQVQPAFAALLSTAAKYKVDVMVHEAARDDIQRDRDVVRRNISLSKLRKFQFLRKVRGLETAELERKFGPLGRPNDIVDATLLDAVERGVADFLVTEDRRLHERARRVSPELGRRVLYVADAVQLLRTTYEAVAAPVRYVEEVYANEIQLTDDIFSSLREDYPSFDQWWREKCVHERRVCWAVFDEGLAGLIVRKDETASDTDATIKAKKILKICTFKVRPEKRGVKLGELLLKKVFWFAQINRYNLAYITTYKTQSALIDLLEYYGFQNTATKRDGELIYEKPFSQGPLLPVAGTSNFELGRLNYPRFVTGCGVRAFGIPIKEGYHDTLYPDLRNPKQADLFETLGVGLGPKRPGNTIRKVYLCRASASLGPPGSLLMFYKGKSRNPPSQALTAIGIFEESSVASSTKDLMLLTGGRSVYSEAELEMWKATEGRPVKVINYLLVAYIEPAVSLEELRILGVMPGHPPQSIFRIRNRHLEDLIGKIDLGFSPWQPKL
ncbi:GNAT family N-acetyltransferase [Microbaculum marinisediminis]|uniref:GNAT family N-acetyltransferase n=1 Tax=Microbaculum marinisediminis TaxID=2931392 RepID=A0AAW5QUX9_9HYPH|nr:GNAT family N-acetyltransferase [Microbaculum sp. A6E488]MCT8970709.1 GNAT family N-acetyltransferase [Microbaculum sp. A6E488]